MEYRLNEFKPAEVKKHRIWLIIGPRGSGKSVLLKDIIYHTRTQYDFGLAFTATTSTVETFKEFLPHHLIYKKGYDYHKGDQFLAICKSLTAAGKQRSTLICLDDCMYDNKAMKSDAMTEIHLNGRHSGITLVNTTQYVMGTVPPAVRTNVDYVLVLQDSVLVNRKRLFEYFFGNFPTFKEFDRVMTQVTENHGCLVLDKTQTSAKVSDAVFYYKAKFALPPFQIGKQIFFAMDQVVKEMRTANKNGAHPRVVTVSM